MTSTPYGGLDHCPICGESLSRRDVVLHGHPGITVSNLTVDWRDQDGCLVFSYEGMMAQLRQMGYIVGQGTEVGKTASVILAEIVGNGPADAHAEGTT